MDEVEAADRPGETIGGAVDAGEDGTVTIDGVEAAGRFGQPPRHRRLGLGPPGLERRLQRFPVRNDGGRREGRGAAPEVDDLVAQRAVALVADGGHDRGRRRADGPAQLLVAEREELRDVSTAAGEDDHVDALAQVEVAEAFHHRLRRGHRHLAEDHRVAGEPRRHHRLDVGAHRCLRPAHDADGLGEPGDRPARPVEQAVGAQPRPGLGDHRGHGAGADGHDLVGHELDAAPAVLPRQRARHLDPLPVDHPCPLGLGRRHRDRHLRGAIAQREVHPPVGSRLRLVDLALHRHLPEAGQGPGDLRAEAHEADPTDGCSLRRVIEQGHERRAPSARAGSASRPSISKKNCAMTFCTAIDQVG